MRQPSYDVLFYYFQDFIDLIRNHARPIRLLLLLLLLFPLTGLAQIRTPPLMPNSSYDNNIGIGPSYGWNLNRDASFWGVSVSYSRYLDNSWSVSLSPAFDRETSRTKTVDGISTSRVNSLTMIATVNYFLSEKVSLTTGFGKGFMDDDNAAKSFKLTNGDWGTGASVAFALPEFPFLARESNNIAASLEYNLTLNEWIISLDLGMGFSF